MRADPGAVRRALPDAMALIWLLGSVLAACAGGAPYEGDDDYGLGGFGGAPAAGPGAGAGAGSGGAAAAAAASGMAGSSAAGSGGVGALDGGLEDAGDGGQAGSGADDSDDEDEDDDDDDDDDVLDEDPVDAGMPNTDDPDGDGDPTWPPPPATDELEVLPYDLASGICAALEGCLGDTLLEVTLAGSECVPRTAAVLRYGYNTFRPASTPAGRVIFDPASVPACLTDYAALGCEVIAERAPASCKQVLDGQVELGDACVIDDDCVAGGFCDRDDACPGLCAGLLSDGDDCNRNDQCESGLQCLDGECAEDAGEGDDCDGDVAPPCHMGTVCIGDDPEMDQAGTCRAREDVLVVEEGDECDVIAGDWCEEGLACVVDVRGTGSSATVVTVCMERVESGDDCHTSLLPQQCPTGEYCPADLDPEYTASCVDRPSSAEACGAFGICAPDHYCDGTRCRPFRLVQGRPCTLDGECLSQNCAEDEDGTGSHCVALDRCRLDGPGECGDDTCNSDETCESCEEDCGECPPDPECGDAACNGTETCGTCVEDCGACPACGDTTCNGTETCSTCAQDCGACPSCGDETCNDGETCATCEADCGACGPVCDDDACEAGETCASCAADCGVCPAPYSGPCDADADCAPDQTCVEHTVPGLFGLTPDVHYGYCAESCDTASDCASSPTWRICTNDDVCALNCDVLLCVFDPTLCCPLGDECIEAVCTHRR